MRALVATCILVTGCGPPVTGRYVADLEQNAERYRLLENARSLVCEWQGGIVLHEGRRGWRTSRVDDMGPTTFANLSVSTHTAEMVGNAGSSPVSVTSGANALNFIERTLSGNINVVTVYAGGNGGGEGGKFHAVWARHVSVEGEPVPSEYFGSCTVRN